MADTSTIKEFLVALGFKVDEAGLKKFGSGIVTATKTVVGLGSALFGAQAALTAFVSQAAEYFEKLYYSSQRAGTTIENLKSLQFAFGQTGMSADNAAGMLEQFRMSLRLNPAMEGLLNGFGVATRGIDGKLKDTKVVFNDFVRYLKSLGPESFFIAAQWAQMFGVSPQQLLMLADGLDKQEEAEKRYSKIAQRMGSTLDEYGPKSVEFMNKLRELGTVVDLLWKGIAGDLMSALEPAMKEFEEFLISETPKIHTFIQNTLKEIDQIIDGYKWIKNHLPSFTNSTQNYENGPKKGTIPGYLWNFLHFGMPQATEDKDTRDAIKSIPDKILDGFKRFHEWWVGHPDTSPTSGSGFDPKMVHEVSYRKDYTPSWAGGKQASGEAGKLFGLIEQTFKLPKGMLDRVWDQESARGQRMLSRSGAMGHFQFMPGTAKRFGLDDPNDLLKSANAAGKYLHFLLQKFGGDVAKALAGYNWGEGSVDAAVAAHGSSWLRYAPAETRNYVSRIMRGSLGETSKNLQPPGSSPTIHQKTDIHIQGGQDPHRTAQEVAVRQRGVNADIIRNLRGVVYA